MAYNISNLRNISLLVSIALFCAMSVPSWAKCRSKELKITIAVASDLATDPTRIHAEKIKSAAAKSLRGQACIELKSTPFAESLANGESQLAALSFAQLSQVVPGYQVLALPFVFDNPFAWQKFSSSKAMFKQALASKGLELLGHRFEGFEQIAAKTPLLSPTDAVGFKFQKDSTNAAILDLISATEFSVKPDELGAALKDGRLDAAFQAWEQLASPNILDNAAYITQTNHRVLGGQIVASTRFLEALPAKLRKKLLTLITTETNRQNEAFAKVSLQSQRATMAKKPVIALTRKQRELWKKALQPLYAKAAQLEGAKEWFSKIEIANR